MTLFVLSWFYTREVWNTNAQKQYYSANVFNSFFISSLSWRGGGCKLVVVVSDVWFNICIWLPDRKRLFPRGISRYGYVCILGLLGGEHIVYSFETFEDLNQRINLILAYHLICSYSAMLGSAVHLIFVVLCRVLRDWILHQYGHTCWILGTVLFDCAFIFHKKLFDWTWILYPHLDVVIFCVKIG